ncbi:MAG: ABC transporter substrate-binding protein [Vulcanimicrobiaceae bacterium]
MILKRLCAALAILFALSVTGGTKIAFAQAKPQIVVRVADQPGAEAPYGAFWIANLKGYFREDGITIDRHTYANGPEAELDLANGHVDMVMAALLPHLQAFANGAPLRIVMSLTKGNTTLVAAKNITNVKQLNNQRVGTPGLGTIHDTALGLVEEENHITVTHVPAKITDLPVMLEKGDIVAFEGWETVAAQTVLTVPGAHYLIRQPVPNNENLELAASTTFTTQHAQAAEAVVRDVVRAMRFISACKPQAIALLATMMNIPDAQKVLDTAWPQIGITDPNLNVKSAVQWINLAVRDEKISAPLAKSDPQAFLMSATNLDFLHKAEAARIPPPVCK